MAKFISKDKRISLRDLYKIIKDEWESVIKHGDGDLRNFTYTTPTWRGLIIFLVRVVPNMFLSTLFLDVYSVRLRERLELTISSGEDGLVGGKELLSIIGHDGEVDLQHPFTWLFLDVALKNGLIEEVKDPVIASFSIVGF